MERKLYIQLTIELDPRSNQNAVHEVAELLRDKVYQVFEEFDDLGKDTVKGVTYEAVMYVDRTKEVTRG